MSEQSRINVYDLSLPLIRRQFTRWGVDMGEQSTIHKIMIVVVNSSNFCKIKKIKRI